MRQVLITILLLQVYSCDDPNARQSKLLYDQSIEYYKQGAFYKALTISEQIFDASSDPKTLGDTKYLRGYLYQKIDSAELAFSEFISASLYYKRMNNLKGLSKVNTELGQIFYENDSYQISKRYFKNALDFAEKTGDNKLKSNALYGLGKAEKRLDNLGNALKYMYQALEIESKLERLQYFINIKLEMADIFHLGTNYKLAMEKNWEVINATQGTELEEITKARVYYNIADLYIDQGDYLNAKLYLDKSDSSSLLTSVDRAILNNNYGRYYHALGYDIIAAQYFEKSLDNNHIHTDMIEVAETKLNIELLASNCKKKDSLLILYKAISIVSWPDHLIREKLERAEQKFYLESLHGEASQAQQQIKERDQSYQHLTLITIMAMVVLFLLLKLRKKVVSSKHSDSYQYYVQMSQQLAKNRKRTREWMKRAKKDMNRR